MDVRGRNEACWCGSGKKYKKCHLVADEAGASTPTGRAAASLPATVAALLLNAEGREGMRRACRFNAQLMDHMRDYVVPGVRTSDLDARVHDYTRDHGAVPATLGYHGFPRSCCISRNDVICHGIPGDEVLREGDIVNLDLTSIVDGWYGDQSETFLVGEVDAASRALVQVAFDAMHAGIAAARPGGQIIEIGRAISRIAHAHGFSVVRDYQGHGIGRTFHQEPGVPHFPDAQLGRYVLYPGVCYTVEPMINAGGYKTRLDAKDGWTVRTEDGRRSAQFEHTVLMTEQGPEILTGTTRGPQPGHRF